MRSSFVTALCRYLQCDTCQCPRMRPSRGYWEHGNNVIYFRGGEHKSKNEGNRGANVILGSREHRKLKSWFWGTRENAKIFQGHKGRGTSPAHTPPQPGRASRMNTEDWQALMISGSVINVSCQILQTLFSVLVHLKAVTLLTSYVHSCDPRHVPPVQSHGLVYILRTPADGEEHCVIFKELRETRKDNIKRPIMCHLNIRSLRHTFND